MDQTTDLDTALGFVIGRIEEEATRSGGMGIQSSPFLNTTFTPLLMVPAMNTTLYCNKCGAPNSVEAQFCSRGGQPPMTILLAVLREKPVRIGKN